MRHLSLLALLVALFVMLPAGGCAGGRCCETRCPPPACATAATAAPARAGGKPVPRQRFFNDGEFDTIITRPENVFEVGMRLYDVRDLLALDGPEYDLLTGIPDLARRRHGATYADISLGRLRVAGPDETHRFVAEALEALRRSASRSVASAAGEAPPPAGGTAR